MREDREDVKTHNHLLFHLRVYVNLTSGMTSSKTLFFHISIKNDVTDPLTQILNQKLIFDE
jgi:hypothetical protein